MSISPTPPMSQPQHMRAVLVLALPLIGSHLAQFAIQAVDTLMLGRYGVDALAGVVLGSTLFFILFLVGSGFAWAVMPMVAAAAEAGDEPRVRRVTRMGLWASLGVGIVALPVLLYSRPLLILIGQEPHLAVIAQSYLRIAGFGMIPALMVMVLKSYLAALGRTRVVLVATVLAAGLNAVLDYALIFGHWGLPELGVQGAAIASVALQLASLGVMVVYSARTLPEHALFKRLWRPDWEALAEVFRMGWQIGLTSLAEVGMFAASTMIIGWIGTTQLAAHGIAMQIATAFFMVHVGLSNAATIRAGRAFGRGDEAGLRHGAAAAVILSGGFALAAVAVYLALPELLIGLFLDPDEPLRAGIVAVGTGLLAVAALFQIADAAQVMALGLLRGVQDTRVPMVHAALSYWAVGVPLSLVLGLGTGLGAQGVWLGLVAGLVLAGALMMTRFWRRVSRLAVA